MRLLPLLLLTSLAAAAETLAIDPGTSSVRFSGTSTLHDFSGTATVVAGCVNLDPAAASGSIEVDAASMATGSADRDERMHNFVMDASSYPKVRFDLTDWTPGAGGGTATGWWTMHGISRPIVIPVTLSPGHAKAAFSLNIRQWDIRTPRMIVVTVGDVVQVDLDLATAPATSPPPARASFNVAGIQAEDGAGASHDLAGAVARPLVLFTAAGAGDAGDWVQALANMPAGSEPIAILAEPGLAEADAAKVLRKAPAGALRDRDGAIAKRLHLPARDVLVLAIGVDGRVSGLFDGGPGPGPAAAVRAACGRGGP
jgi:polyisoprenoid-binding protein YceI